MSDVKEDCSFIHKPLCLCPNLESVLMWVTA